MKKRGNVKKEFSSDNPNPIDKYIGNRIRLRRTLLGYSQEKLAEAVGITFQQIQKYENATNRVGGSRMYELAKTLGVKVSFFYEGLEEHLSGENPEMVKETIECPVRAALPEGIAQSKQSLKLIRNFNMISEDVRVGVYELIRKIAKAED